MSPETGRSILITRAPRSASRVAAHGPARNWAKSSTRRPSSGRMAVEEFGIFVTEITEFRPRGHGGLPLAEEKGNLASCSVSVNSVSELRVLCDENSKGLRRGDERTELGS